MRMNQAHQIFENHNKLPKIIEFDNVNSMYKLTSLYSDAKDTGSTLYQVLNEYNEKWTNWKTAWECCLLCHVVVLPEARLINGEPMYDAVEVTSSLSSSNIEFII